MAEIKKSALAVAAMGLIGLSGCASIIDGTSQQIAINTSPSGATCALYRQGERIGTVSPTPGAYLVKKNKYDITIMCAKQGYDLATYRNHSGMTGTSFGNIILGGGVGAIVDSASGADNHYTPDVNITLPLGKDANVTPELPANVATQQES